MPRHGVIQQALSAQKKLIDFHLSAGETRPSDALALRIADLQESVAALTAELAKIERQEPVAEMTLVDMGIGDARQLRVNWLMDGYLDVGAKLYAAAGASPVEPNFCESCAMDLSTCDCVTPRPVFVNQLPSAQPSQAVVVEPVYQYQLANGNWIDQTKESYDYNVKHGQATVRMLYATAQAAAQFKGAEMKQLTDEQIEEMARQEQLLLVCDDLEALTEIVRATERALAALDTAQPVQVNAVLLSELQIATLINKHFYVGMTPDYSHCKAFAIEAVTAAKQAQPERAEDSVNAKRYLWLRDEAYSAGGETPFIVIGRDDSNCYVVSGTTADEAIDAAIKQGGQQ